MSLLPGTAFLLPVPATTSCVSIKSMWTISPWDLSSSAWHPVPVLISREMEIVCGGRGVGGWVELVHVVMEAGNLKHLQSEIIDWKLWNCWRYSLIWRKTDMILLLPGTLVFFFKPGKVRATHKYDGWCPSTSDVFWALRLTLSTHFMDELHSMPHGKVDIKAWLWKWNSTL